ncbi:MAG: N utilization substance protein B [Saprospiraceae bacterium]|jgi:N utilization substance protein B|uniref:transcription antitermination factor NusB n=1 Tax=Candidatus Marifrigoribacter sp. Uisw_064 TaxID=3230970 RepID=UPI003AE9AFC7
MLTRRHIRVKVMQAVYSLNKSGQEDLTKQEKFLLYNMEQMQDLYLLLLQLLLALKDQAENKMVLSKKKHLATELEKNPSRNFIENKVLALIDSHASFSEIIKKKKLNYWEQDDEYAAIIYNILREQEWYAAYLAKKEPSFKEDQEFLIRLYKEIIAPNEKLYEYLEDKRLTWLDDYPLVNTLMVKMLSKISLKNIGTVLIPDVYKDKEDRNFALKLFREVITNDEKLYSEIEGKTPNWDKERIAGLDMIILKMGISEFLYFPSIPVRATINEYLEISKEYSTPKSSIFINGILDKLVKDFSETNKLNKIGRGLK